MLGGVEGAAGAPRARTPAGPVLPLATLAPGRAVERPLVVANAGTAPGTFLLAASATGSRELLRALSVRVAEAERIVYEGPPAGLRGVSLGTVAAGQERRLTLRVELPSAAGNTLQGRSGGLEVTVTALG